MNPYATIIELSAALKAGGVGVVELTEALLTRIEVQNPKLGAFIEVMHGRALTEARSAQESIRAGRYLGPLHGIPYAAKDLFDVAGVATTAGTHFLNDNIAARDCTVVRRLSDAGMILLGKTITCQLAADIIGLNFDRARLTIPGIARPTCRVARARAQGFASRRGWRRWRSGRTPGARFVFRRRTVVGWGLKTTVGRVSRQGVFPESTTLDSVGPLTRTVEDAALVYHAIHGPDREDETTLNFPEHDTLIGLKTGVQGLRIAFAEGVLFEDLHPDVEAAVREAGQVLSSLGARLTSIELAEFQSVLEMTPDPWRCLSVEGYACHQTLFDKHGEELDPMAQNAMAGKHVLAVDYYRVLRQLLELQRRVSERMNQVDVVLVPTVPIPAVTVEEAAADRAQIAKYAGIYVRNTSVGNLLRLCSVSVPCGFCSKGLPIGLMIYAKPFDEAMALRVAYAYEQATEWHDVHPDLSWFDSDSTAAT